MNSPEPNSDSHITVETLFRAMRCVGLDEVVPNEGTLEQEDLRSQPPILLNNGKASGNGGALRGRHQFWLGRPNAFLCETRKSTPELLGDGMETPRPRETLRRVVEEAGGKVLWPNNSPAAWNSTASLIYGLVHDHFSKFAESENKRGKEPAVLGLIQAHELVWSQDGVIKYHFDGMSEIESTVVPTQERIDSERATFRMGNCLTLKHPELEAMLAHQRDLFDQKVGAIFGRVKWQGPDGLTSARGKLTKVKYVYSVTPPERNRKLFFTRHQVHARIPDKGWRQKGDDLPIVSGLTLPLVPEGQLLDLYKTTRTGASNKPDHFLLPRDAAAGTSLELEKAAVAFRLPVIRFGRVFLGRRQTKTDRWYGIHDVLSFTMSESGHLVEFSIHRDYLDGLFSNNAFWKAWMRKNSGMWK